VEVDEMMKQLGPAFAPVFRSQNRVTLAGAALRGLLAREDYRDSPPDTIAAHAVALADAVLRRLDRSQPESL